jgi:hypothetical protein
MFIIITKSSNLFFCFAFFLNIIREQKKIGQNLVDLFILLKFN